VLLEVLLSGGDQLDASKLVSRNLSVFDPEKGVPS
jgi:hypothetical protein